MLRFKFAATPSVCIVIALIAGTLTATVPMSNADGSIGDDVADLQDQLEAGLKARRPVEFQYLAYVVSRVKDETLPLKLVLSSFQWARKRHRRYPFVYFERALRERARREGITLPTPEQL